MVELGKLLKLVVDKNASDLHLTVGNPPTITLKGDLRPLNLPPLRSSDTALVMKAITPKEIQDEVKAGGSGEFDYAIEGNARLHVSVYVYKGDVALKLRLSPRRFPDVPEGGPPPAARLCLETRSKR